VKKGVVPPTVRGDEKAKEVDINPDTEKRDQSYPVVDKGPWGPPFQFQRTTRKNKGWRRGSHCEENQNTMENGRHMNRKGITYKKPLGEENWGKRQGKKF